MNCVGIIASKGKSIDAVMHPFGNVVISLFKAQHTASELNKLARQLKSLDGETRVVIEYTGNCHAPVACLLHDAGLYVSVVNAKLVHKYGNNSLRQGKTDKKETVTLANYGLDHRLTLPRYVSEEDRLMLKTCYRQHQQYSKVQTMLKNNLISMRDIAFPDTKRLLTSLPPYDGREKWADFAAVFYIASESVTCLGRPLPPSTKSGAESTATISAKIRRWTFMPPSVGTSVLCRKQIPQNFWPTGRFLSPGNFLRTSCSRAGATVPGGFSTGASCGDGDVWCWPYPRPPTHGRNRRCAPFSFRKRVNGIYWH